VLSLSIRYLFSNDTASLAFLSETCSFKKAITRSLPLPEVTPNSCFRVKYRVTHAMLSKRDAKRIELKRRSLLLVGKRNVYWPLSKTSAPPHMFRYSDRSILAVERLAHFEEKRERGTPRREGGGIKERRNRNQ